MSRARDLADRVLHNRTHEDTDGGRESIVTFKGEQSGGEISTLAQIQASHDGTGDDQKSDLIFKTNDGNDGASPSEVLRLDSVGSLGLGASIPASSATGVYLTGGGATYSTSSTYRYDMVNAYFDTAASAWKYIGNGVATQIYQANGSIIFNRAVANSSGAGAALTWVEEARINEHGLTFNGDTAEANALNDYEEGTFNVTFSGATVSVGSNVANYTKIGNMVYWRYYTGVSTISSSSSSLILGGLPFNVANAHGNYSGVNVGINTFFGSSVTDGQKAYHQINHDYIYFVNPATISSPSAVNGSSKYLMVGGFYQAA